MPRDYFDPDTLYVVEQRDGSLQYARTPDGIGAYWYDDREEAEGDVSTPTRRRHFDSPREFDEWREALES